MKNDLSRFWSKVRKTETCWLWTGGKNGNGYGAFRIDGKQIAVHRLAWALANGPIPRGLLVCHRCDTPLCVRHDHLFVGTVAENSADMAKKGRAARGERNCKAKLSPEGVAEMRRAYAAGGVSKSELGRRFGISTVMACYIINRKNWKHL